MLHHLAAGQHSDSQVHHSSALRLRVGNNHADNYRNQKFQHHNLIYQCNNDQHDIVHLNQHTKYALVVEHVVLLHHHHHLGHLHLRDADQQHQLHWYQYLSHHQHRALAADLHQHLQFQHQLQQHHAGNDQHHQLFHLFLRHHNDVHHLDKHDLHSYHHNDTVHDVIDEVEYDEFPSRPSCTLLAAVPETNTDSMPGRADVR
mmetsp:Transcript_126634/g.300864  ORF Transcript_126634/g.300864 Transcript_126634/m.300864 type:complete len:202 (+) Transcript_126634:345-950(+)